MAMSHSAMIFGVLGLFLATFGEGCFAQPMGAPDPLMTRLMATETHKHVGDTLPKGIVVVDVNGEDIDLRGALEGHGPLILVKVSPQCPPCKRLLDAIRRSNGKSAGSGKPANIVVLQVNDAEHKSLELPQNVLDLHSASEIADEEIFVGGQITPSAFYFDGSLKLIERRAGMTTPEEILAFPSSDKTAS